MTRFIAVVRLDALRKPAPIVIVVLLVAAGIFILSQRRHRLGTTSESARDGNPFTQVSSPVVEPAPAAVQPPGAIVVLPKESAAVKAAVPEAVVRQYVFRLQLDQSRCTLETMEEVSGAFGRERIQQWQPGMLCCRLVAADGHVVSERTMPAPDYVCVVLDPNNGGNDPVASRLTANGPAVFQVRFPQIDDAARLEVHRIATDARPADAGAKIGTLIASIPIPTK